MKKILFVLALAALGCNCLADCSMKYCTAENVPRVKRVVLVGVDGFGAQWIPWNKMPNLTKLRADGLYAVGRNSFPTSSGINWCTCMNGTVVEVHGYREWNSKAPDVPPPPAALDNGKLPCIFHEIKKQDPAAYTVSLYNWDGIGFVHNTNEVDYVKYFAAGSLEQRDDDTMATALKLLKEKQPKFTYVYQHLPDCYGHKCGWGTPEFTNACVNVDKNLGKLVKCLEETGLRDDTLILLVADHGGQGKKHGMALANCFDIPFLVSGPAVKEGFRLREPVLLADAAPTILAALGYKVPEVWRGRPAVTRK